MFPGQSMPAPKGKIWITAYMDSRTECFEINTCDEKSPTGVAALFHKEYSTGTAIADFVRTNINSWDMQIKVIQEVLDAINAGKDIERNFDYLYGYTRYWYNESAVFLPLSASLQRLHIQFEAGEKLTLVECVRQMNYYKDIQSKLARLAYAFFETDQPQNMKELYAQRQGDCGYEEYPHISFGSVSLERMWKGISGIFPYDDWLDEPYVIKEEEIFTEVLKTETPNNLIDFILYRYLTENIRFRACKLCGSYFGIVGNSKVEYCDRVIPGSKKTCREMGPHRIYSKRKMGEPAIREYKRSYKAHNARIRYGLMTREEFNAWSLEAREKRDQCLTGKLSLEKFVEWLDSDKMRQMD